MRKRNTIDYVCYNNKCKNNENGFCQLKGIKPCSCVDGITKQGYELWIEWRDKKIKHLEMVLKRQIEHINELQQKSKGHIEKLVETVENQAGQDLKPMWDKWQEEMTK